MSNHADHSNIIDAVCGVNVERIEVEGYVFDNWFERMHSIMERNAPIVTSNESSSTML